MKKIVGRVIDKFLIKNTNEEIYIIHNDTNYRIVIDKDKINTKQFNIGDIIEFEGINFKGKYSDKYIEFVCTKLSLIKKTSLPLNECAINKKNKFNENKERKYFHTKMIVDDKCIEKIKIGSEIIKSIRKSLDDEGFIECRTPIITNTFHGGGALPFEVYVNHKHKKCFLRANSILPLSMYLAGGLERIFEIGEYFRNGSIDKTHSVPYLATEIYATNIEYDNMIEFAKSIFYNIIHSINKMYNYNINKNVNIISFENFIKEKEYSNFSLEKLEEYFDFTGMEYNKNTYENINNLYKHFKDNVMPNINETIIITNLPAGISPLIDSLENNKKILKRAFLFYKGHNIMEIAFSSNNSEIILDELKKQNNSLEKMNRSIVDKSCDGYEHALKLGILPMASITISVERLIALICNNDNIIENLIDV